MADSIKRFNKQQRQRDAMDMSTLSSSLDYKNSADPDTTVMTENTFTDTASMRATPKRTALTPGGNTSKSSIQLARGQSGVGRGGAGRGPRGASGTRGSALPRGRGRGIR